MTQRTSRLSGFYKNSVAERAAMVAQWAGLNAYEQAILEGQAGLDAAQADHMIENVVGTFSLPLGIATNFLVNGQDYLIPMVVEEPSVVAAASNAARMFRSGGGFTASSDESIMIGQIQIVDLEDIEAAAQALAHHRDEIIHLANTLEPVMIRVGNGAQDMAIRPFPETPIGPMLVLHLHYDCQDAMGANAINTTVEKLAPRIEQITGGRVNLRILSNLADQRKVRAEGLIPADMLATETLSGEAVVKTIVEAGVFAEVDPYRAATHNKGIMNGIDPVVIATGNDWRAIEAGAHAYAARSGQYTSLTHWWQDGDGNLRGRIELPMAVGIVGGATRTHPTAQVALKIMGIERARQLGEIIASVGLAQNLGAMRALATEGIQRGHMSLHARQIAVSAGATGDLVQRIVQTMIDEGNIRLDRARELVIELEK